jgi:molybdate transport system substrate-binding protein
MTPTDREGRAGVPTRLVLAVLASLLLLVTAACSDAPTEKEIAMADDGVDPSIIPIFTSEQLLRTVTELGTIFLVDHPGITFRYTAKDPDTLSQRVREQTRPALWIDDAEVLAPFIGDPAAVGAPVRVGDDVMHFIVNRNYAGENPTLEVFGPGTFPTATALCDTSIPCGSTAHEILRQAGVTPEPDATVAVAREAMVKVADNTYQTSLLYRTDAAGLYTGFRLVALPDPTIGAKTYQSLRMSDNATAAAFQTWIDQSPDAAAILVKFGYRPVPGAKIP